MKGSLARGLVAAGLGALCAGSIAYGLKTPAVLGVDAPATEFSAERAMRHVAAIAKGPHATGSAAHLEVLRYLQAEITKLGLTPQIQDATGVGTRYAVVGRVRNVLARIAGRNPGGAAVLLMSHYDGVPAGPAAADAASGTAVLLETARALRAGPPLEHDVILLFTDSEESGLLGAAVFAKEHPWANDAAVVLNFEARGVNGPSFMFETGPGNADVARVLRSVPGTRATSLSTAVYRRLPNDTDLSEVSVLELPALNFAFIGDVGRYHTTEDDVAHLSKGSVQHHGRQALALARAFGNDLLPRPKTGDAVFFFAPLVGLVSYAEELAVPIAVLAILLLVVGTWSRLRTAPGAKSGAARSLVLGFSIALLAPVVAALLGYVIGGQLIAFHTSLHSGASRFSGWYALGVALLAVFCVTLAPGFAKQRLGDYWHEGMLFAWSGVSLAIAISVPGASFLFTWPLIAATLSGRWPESTSRVTLTVVAVVVSVFIIVPTTYMMVSVALGLDAVGGAVLGLLVAMAASLLAPILLGLAGDRPRALPLASGAAAIVAFGIGLATVRTNAERPASSALTYVADADSGGAWLSGYGGTGATHWVASALRAARSDSAPLPSWVRRLTRARPIVGVRPSASALGAASATVLKNTVAGDVRTVSVRIKPSPGTMTIGMQMDTGTVTSAVVNGKVVDRSRYRNPTARWSLEFIAPPDSGFVIALTVPANEPAVLGISARAPGLPALQGVTVPPRPAGVLAIQTGDASVVYHRVRF
jgi:hypothetical protein